MQTGMPIESFRDHLRAETSRWLEKAIALIRDPHRAYENEVRELWRGERRRGDTPENHDDD